MNKALQIVGIIGIAAAIGVEVARAGVFNNDATCVFSTDSSGCHIHVFKVGTHTILINNQGGMLELKD